MPQNIDVVRKHLERVVQVLERHGEYNLARRAKAAASAPADQLDAFLTSNDLWGGAGSIADQACMPEGLRTDARREVERALVELGKHQLHLGKVNPRTAGWVATFEEWAGRGI